MDLSRLGKWWRRRFPSLTPEPIRRPRQRPRKLCLEQLESRLTPTVNISIGGGGTILEGDSPQPPNAINYASFSLSIDCSTSIFGATVAFSTVDGTAQAGIDYQGTSFSQTVPPFGSLSISFSVQIYGNTTLQLDRSFNFQVTAISTFDTFSITGSPVTATIQDDDTPTLLTLNAGNNQVTATGTAFPTQLAVNAYNVNGNLVTGAPVAFTVNTGGSGQGGTFAGSSTVDTNASGVATAPVLTANAIGGAYTVSATSGTGSTSFNETNRKPAFINVTSGSPQTATVASAFASQLTATVTDQFGNAVPNATVTFTAPSGSVPSATFGSGGGLSYSTTTNASGVAVSPIGGSGSELFANQVAGSYSVAASVSGVGTPASFSLTNTPGSAASIATAAGTPQSTAVAANFSTNLQAIIRDAYNNPVGAGTLVTYTVNSVGGSGALFSGSTTATALTNSSGVATAPTLTANNVIGSYTVTASTSGVSPNATFNLANVAGAPASITATAGSGQATTVKSNFGTALQATVLDTFGNPVSGATVTFTAPSSPGANFGGNLTATAATNSSGIATTSVVPTADFVAGSYTISATVSGVATAASYSLTNTAGAASNILASAGSGQGSTVNTNFGTNLQAKVTDTYGNPIGGVVVTFTAPASAASGSFSGSATITASTNASGFATAPTFTANSVSGSYSLTATFSGGPTATYSLQNNPGTPANIAVTAGSGQSTTVNTNFATALQATVTDAFGNPVAAGYSVTFTAPSSGATGTFAGSATGTAFTNASGVATAPTLAANTVAGSYSVSASVSGASSSAVYTLTNNPGAPVSMSVTPSSAQSATVAGNFATALQATISDSFGNPVPGVSVTFTAPATGASGVFGGSNIVTTNGSGVATAPTFTANTIAGSYSVQASASGVSPSGSFSMTNTPGAAALISATAGATQQTTVGTAFGTAMQATVTDQYGNPITNASVSVTFTAPSAGASGTFTGGTVTATASINSSGVATAPTFTANTIAGGPYNVTATFSGASNSASFALTNNAGAAATVTVTAGSGQSTFLGTAFATALQATVKDQNGNLVPNAVVVFSAPTTGASGTFSVGSSVSVLTNSAGVATAPTFTANLYSGSYGVTASSGSATSARFSLTNKSAAVRLVVVAPATIVAGRPFNITVKALDATGHLTPYTGTVTFSGTAGPVGLPANYTFQPSDMGKHVFTVRIRAVGNQKIFIRDTQNSSLVAVLSARGFYSYRLS